MIFYRQYELVMGTTHWIAWFDDDTIKPLLKEGWQVLHAYTKALLRNKAGALVESAENMNAGLIENPPS